MVILIKGMYKSVDWYAHERYHKYSNIDLILNKNIEVWDPNFNTF
jgi:hypothetical protein